MFLKDLFFRLLSMTVWKGKVHSPKVQSKTVNLSHNRHLPNRGWNHDNARCSTCALQSEVLNCAGGIVCFEGFLFTSLSKIWQRSELINLDQFPEHSEKDRERERDTQRCYIFSHSCLVWRTWDDISKGTETRGNLIAQTWTGFILQNTRQILFRASYGQALSLPSSPGTVLRCSLFGLWFVGAHNKHNNLLVAKMLQQTLFHIRTCSNSLVLLNWP